MGNNEEDMSEYENVRLCKSVQLSIPCFTHDGKVATTFNIYIIMIACINFCGVPCNIQNCLVDIHPELIVEDYVIQHIKGLVD